MSCFDYYYYYYYYILCSQIEVPEHSNCRLVPSLDPSNQGVICSKKLDRRHENSVDQMLLCSSGVWRSHHHHHHHHLFLKRLFLPRSARVRRFSRYEVSPHIPEHHPFRVQTQLLHIIPHTFSPSLPAPTRTSHPCHHHISTGRHPVISTLTLHMPKPPQSTTPHHLSHTLDPQKTVQIHTALSILQRHPTHPSHHHPFRPLQALHQVTTNSRSKASTAHHVRHASEHLHEVVWSSRLKCHYGCLSILCCWEPSHDLWKNKQKMAGWMIIN